MFQNRTNMSYLAPSLHWVWVYSYWIPNVKRALVMSMCLHLRTFISLKWSAWTFYIISTHTIENSWLSFLLSTTESRHFTYDYETISEKCEDNNESCVHRVTQVLGQGIDPNSIANNQESYMASLHRTGILWFSYSCFLPLVGARTVDDVIIILRLCEIMEWSLHEHKHHK